MSHDERNVPDLLAAARRGLSPSVGDRERVRRMIDASLRGGAQAAAASATMPAASPVSPAAWLGRPWARVVLAGAVAAASGGIGYRAGWRAGHDARREAPVAGTARAPGTEPSVPTTPPARAARATAPVAGPPPTGPVVALEPASATAARSAARRRASSEAHGEADRSTAGSFGEEVRVLRAAERALREGTPAFALALLRQLDRAVPGGQLVEEREAMTAIARCATGEVPLGVDLAGDFTDRHPGSVYGKRVAEACAETDSKAPGDTQRRRISR